jgi:hypothetical protein
MIRGTFGAKEFGSKDIFHGEIDNLGSILEPAVGGEGDYAAFHGQAGEYSGSVAKFFCDWLCYFSTGEAGAQCPLAIWMFAISINSKAETAFVLRTMRRTMFAGWFPALSLTRGCRTTYSYNRFDYCPSDP